MKRVDVAAHKRAARCAHKRARDGAFVDVAAVRSTGTVAAYTRSIRDAAFPNCLTLRLERDTIENVEAVAAALGLTRAETIRHAIDVAGGTPYAPSGRLENRVSVQLTGGQLRACAGFGDGNAARGARAAIAEELARWNLK